MTGFTRSLVSRSNYGKNFWKLLLRQNPQQKFLSTKPFIQISGRNLDVRQAYATAATLEQPSGPSSPMARSLAFVGLMVGSGLATYYFYPRPQEAPIPEIQDEIHTVSNWSNTHELKSKVYIQPESLEELERVVEIAHSHKQKIRAVGSGLSPNGIGLCSEGMVNLALMDEILKIDKDTQRVTVQAAARVEQVVKALKPYGLRLPNYASIME